MPTPPIMRVTLSPLPDRTTHHPKRYGRCSRLTLSGLAKAELNPAACLDGLAGYSHAVLTFVFHANTNAGSGKRFKAKIAPPRMADFGGDPRSWLTAALHIMENPRCSCNPRLISRR